ncbi:MAG: PrpF domain-containing protein [Rothia sp. (in: high G+C Gram-positive bacteria)]|nr:PrpF domain-containing protein [Rothia sp. (in: high G+C Gram-positive bacteria)]
MTILQGHWYRGGTSKCWLFGPDDLAGTREHITQTLVQAFGSSDKRQLHGIGGGTSTTSKAAVISQCDTGEADINYLFAQVGIGEETVEYTSNCGNCSSAVALFALDQRLVEPTGDLTTVRMKNENTNAIVTAVVETPGGTVPRRGTVLTPGVQEPGVGVDVTFEHVDGTSTGALLPTGRTCDTAEINGQQAKVTYIDAGAPAALIDAADLGATGAESLSDVREKYLHQMIQVRAEGAVRMGLADNLEDASPATPKVGLVGAPQAYTAATNENIAATDYDLSARMVSMFDAHPAIGITSAVAIARSALVEGSTVQQILLGQGIEPHTDGFSLRIGTLSGVVTSTITTNPEDQSISISVLRSAQHIANAEIFI